MMLFKNEPTQAELMQKVPAIFSGAASDKTSSRYLYIPTFELLQNLSQDEFKVTGAMQVGTRKEDKSFAKHVVYLTHPSLSSISKVGEELPMLALTNSHNATSSFSIDTAFFRLACANGLLMPTTSRTSARIMHRKGMELEVMNAALNVAKAFPEQVRVIETMKGVQLDSKATMELAERAVELVFDSKAIELNKQQGIDLSARVLRIRRHADNGSDLWRVFNVIQENLIKGGMRIVMENEQGVRRLQRTRAINSIDRSAKVNKNLMELAQSYAQIGA